MKFRCITLALSLFALFGDFSFASAAETFFPLQEQLTAETAALAANTNLMAAEKRRLRALGKAFALLTNNTSEVGTFRRILRALPARKFPSYQPLLTNAGLAVLEGEWQRHEELTNLIAHLPTLSPFTNTAAAVRTHLAEVALASVTNVTRLSSISSRLMRADRAVQAELNRFAVVLTLAVPSNSIRADWSDNSGNDWRPVVYGWAVASRGYQAEGMEWVLQDYLYGMPGTRRDLESHLQIAFVEGRTTYTTSDGASCSSYIGKWFGFNYQIQDLGEADEGEFRLYPLGNEYVILFGCSGPQFSATTGLARLEKRYIGQSVPEP